MSDTLTGEFEQIVMTRLRGGAVWLEGKWPKKARVTLEFVKDADPQVFGVRHSRLFFECVNTRASYHVFGWEDGCLLVQLVDQEWFDNPLAAKATSHEGEGRESHGD